MWKRLHEKEPRPKKPSTRCRCGAYDLKGLSVWWYFQNGKLWRHMPNRCFAADPIAEPSKRS